MKYIKLFEEHYPWYKDYKYNILDGYTICN